MKTKNEGCVDKTTTSQDLDLRKYEIDALCHHISIYTRELENYERNTFNAFIVSASLIGTIITLLVAFTGKTLPKNETIASFVLQFDFFR